MASLPTIYTIQASDAPQHTDRLREIMQKLETENRIKGFTTLGVVDDLSSMSDTLKKDDMILILLTNELKEKGEQVKKRANTLKADQPGLRVAEILVDNVVFDNEFITFPDDLRPIRNREDMDEAWSNIARSLRDIFPVKKKKKAKPFPVWVLFAVLGVFLFGGLLIFILPTDSGEETEETYTTVPDLAGMSGTEAVSLLLDAGLEAGQRRVESHETVNRDLVIRSEPNAGDSIEIGVQVTLILSSGREQIRVPELAGVTLDRARAVLEREGLRAGQQQSEHSNEIERARVIRTNPTAGSEVDHGSQVNLVISDGRERIIEIIGTDDMRFVVASEDEGLVTGSQVGEEYELKQILASPGEELRIILHTRSQLPGPAMSHNLAILELGTNIDQFIRESITARDNDYIAPDLEDQVIATTSMLVGGESDTIEFTVPDETGEYDFVCSFPGHFATGMAAQMIIQ